MNLNTVTTRRWIGFFILIGGPGLLALPKHIILVNPWMGVLSMLMILVGAVMMGSNDVWCDGTDWGDR